MCVWCRCVWFKIDKDSTSNKIMLEALIQNTDGSLLTISDSRIWTKENKNKIQKLKRNNACVLRYCLRTSIMTRLLELLIMIALPDIMIFAWLLFKLFTSDFSEVTSCSWMIFVPFDYEIVVFIYLFCGLVNLVVFLISNIWLLYIKIINN